MALSNRTTHGYMALSNRTTHGYMALSNRTIHVSRYPRIWASQHKFPLAFCACKCNNEHARFLEVRGMTVVPLPDGWIIGMASEVPANA